MPLPRYQARESAETRVRVPHVPMPNIGPMFEAWGEVARLWEETQDKLRKADEAVTLAEIDSATRQDMVEVSQALTASGDPANRGPRFLQAMQERSEPRLASLEEKNPALAKRARASVIGLVGTHAAQEHALGFALQRDDIAARGDTQLEILADRVATAPTDPLRDEAKAELDRHVAGLVNSGVWTRTVATTKQAKATERAELGAATRMMQQNPEAFQLYILDQTTKDGKVVYTHLSSLDTAQRYALYNNAAGLAKQRQAEWDEAARQYTDAKAANIITVLYKKQLDLTTLPVIVEGLPADRVAHIFNFQDALVSRERESVRWNETERAKRLAESTNRFLARIPLSTVSQARRTADDATIAMGAGEIDEGGLATIKAHVQSQLAHLRNEARQDLSTGEAKANLLERELRKQYAAAVHEIPSWLAVDPSALSDETFRRAYGMAKDRVEAAGSRAVLEGVAPRDAMFQAVPEAMLEMYGTLDATEAEMWGRLAPFKSEQEYALAVQEGRITDPMQRIRMVNAWRTLRLIQVYKPKPKPQPAPTTEVPPPGGPPSAQRKPFTPAQRTSAFETPTGGM